MTPVHLQGSYAVEASPDASRVVLRGPLPSRRVSVHLSGYQGSRLPATLRDPKFDPTAGTPSSRGRWRLHTAGEDFAFEAIGVDVHESLPHLFDSLTERWRPRWHQRAALQLLLRLPGGPRLLRAWQTRRA